MFTRAVIIATFILGAASCTSMIENGHDHSNDPKFQPADAGRGEANRN